MFASALILSHRWETLKDLTALALGGHTRSANGAIKESSCDTSKKKGSCHRDADHVNPFSVCMCPCVCMVCVLKILSEEGDYSMQPVGGYALVSGGDLHANGRETGDAMELQTFPSSLHLHCSRTTATMRQGKHSSVWMHRCMCCLVIS